MAARGDRREVVAGEQEEVSPLTLNRLSFYLRCLRHLQELGIKRVSSQEMARRYHLSATQIRKDLAQFGEFGIRGVGYEVDELADHLNALLGLDRQHALVIVGMGNLGSALAQYLGFNYGAFHVVAGVDNDPRKIGRRVGSFTVRAAASSRRSSASPAPRSASSPCPPKPPRRTTTPSPTPASRASSTSPPSASNAAPACP